MINLPTTRPLRQQPQFRHAEATAMAKPAPPRPSISSGRIQPSAGQLKALYLRATHRAAPLRFAGMPPEAEIQAIIAGLGGWQKQPNVVGPSYFAEPQVVDALETSFHSEEKVKEDTIQRLALQKARAQNIHNLLLNQPPVSPEALHDDATAFVRELQDRMHALNRMLTQSGISYEGVALFSRYAAVTAPVQYVMAFPDAVAHAADVAQLSFLQAKKHGASEPEALQALLVGWLHDPKLPGAVSWSNLATHPVVASSIARHTLAQQESQEALNAYFRARPSAAMTPDTFAEGIVEALAINNDSKWVLDNVILHQFPHHPLAEPGLADVGKHADATACRDIELAMTDRFLAPSQGVKPAPLGQEELSRINQVELSTDLRGIDCERLTDAMREAITPKVLDGLLNGDPNNHELWTQTQTLLKDHVKTAVINPKVRGGTLASHHDDVEKAPLAAFSLATADPLLLSPHKVMAQTKGDTAFERLTSFVQSFENNIRFLPKNTKPEGQGWMNHVFRSLLASADEVSGNQSQASEEARSRLNNAEALREHVLTPATWQGNKGDYASLSPQANPGAFQALLANLKTHYEQAVKTVLMSLPSRPQEPQLVPVPLPCPEPFHPSALPDHFPASASFAPSRPVGQAQ